MTATLTPNKPRDEPNNYVVNHTSQTMHKAYIDANGRIYTQEVCNVDDMEETEITSSLDRVRSYNTRYHYDYCKHCWPNGPEA